MSRIGKIDRAIIEHLIDAEALMRIDGGVQPSKFRAKRHVDAPWHTLAQVFSKEPAVTARGNVLTKRKVHRRCPHLVRHSPDRPDRSPHAWFKPRTGGNRPWSMDELVARLQGRYSARPHPMHIGTALRTTRRDWSGFGYIAQGHLKGLT
jgi:hypothetical protein